MSAQPASTIRLRVADGDRPALRAVWPGLFAAARLTEPKDALPVADADLAPLLAMTIPGPAGPTWAGRQRSLARHFRGLEAEFGGTSRLAHLLGCVIVALRRHPEDATALTLFRRVTDAHGDAVAEAMNLRWLTSVCDTFCDIGTSPQKATALTGTLVANIVKLAETERRVFHPPRRWPPATRLSSGGALFDGVITFWTTKGDMIDNLLARSEAVLADRNAATPFVVEILLRLARHDTVLRRLMSINDGRDLPMAGEAAREAAKKAMRGL